MERRDFLRFAALGSAASVATKLPAMAGPFQASDFEQLVPADKKLDPAWVNALFARGTRTVYRGAELEKIGMPVGGICTGQLYLGGDGRLWHWDIFNQYVKTIQTHYYRPMQPDFPLEQGFAVRIAAAGKTSTHSLDRRGFAEISFAGEYPIGFVEYRDPAVPVNVSLEAFSPFIPLNADDSHLPATVMRFTVRNKSDAKVQCDLVGWMQNAVCLRTGVFGNGSRTNAVVRQRGVTLLEYTAQPLAPPASPPREPIVFADFEGKDYGPWKVQGEAFGSGPAAGARIRQRLSGFRGKGLVNSWAGSGALQGKLTSPEFTIERPYISFLIAGTNYPGHTCINLLVDGKVVRTETGKNADALAWANWDVRDLAGKTAHLEIVDEHRGKRGHIDIDSIEFDDWPRTSVSSLREQQDYGSMCLALLDGKPDDLASAALAGTSLPDKLFDKNGLASGGDSTREFPAKPIGAVGRTLSLEPGAEATVTFVVTWYFPNIRHLLGGRVQGRRYGKRFGSAREVAEYVAKHFVRLAGETRLWHDTWYDSTLPYWFLDRTFANTSTLATSTCYWFGNGRFYGWEGVGCCAGTCTHVWHYAQAVARLFPSLERSARKMVDFGLAFNAETGEIRFRGEYNRSMAVDGQAGTILRAYREHQMSADNALLQEIWPRVKSAMECLTRMDNGEGILEGSQHNTLDAAWFGKISWLSSLYVVAARACEEMANEMGDEAFARQMRQIIERGGRSIDRELFNGEYYVQIADKTNRGTVGSYNGCEIDQVCGQSWAFQVGLGRIFSPENVKKALASLWRYNFTPDVGPFRQKNRRGRWYALAGEGGLIMCTWPQGDTARVQQGVDSYFNECMTGFEYQVAGHMIWEGMVQEGLAITRTIHDRYHASRRNPWNEVECGDHYARAMASYGVYLAACGYEYHGPKGHLAFAPRLSPEDFRAAFTTAEGWGTFSQQREDAIQREKIQLKWGKLRLRTLAFALPEGTQPLKVAVTLSGKPLGCKHVGENGRVHITLAADAVIEAGQTMEIRIG